MDERGIKTGLGVSRFRLLEWILVEAVLSVGLKALVASVSSNELVAECW